ncbi:Kinesin-like protein KIN-14C [Frankliniella fusca]|uniref:Kinesin-like protein KIN-14C n=1 Tax=Frankliniella fusca TaxID=407009 RepID=A0AAE1HC18_9NEOP|nr:Kinesin-like protein KIN-14C [Frankliniella fusca]
MAAGEENKDSSTGSKETNSSKSSKDKTVEESPSSSHASNQFNVPFDKLLGEENWPDWRMLMELYLGDLFACTLKDPDPSVLADRQCIEFKNDFTARQKISFEPTQYLRGATTAHQAWSRLCNALEDKGVFRRAALLRKLVSLRQDSTLAQYVFDFKEVVNQIADTGKAIEDELCSVLLLENVKPIHKSSCQIVERTCQTKLPDGSPTLEFSIISEELLREGNKIKSEEISKIPSTNNAALKISPAPTKSGKSRDGSWQHSRGGGGSKPPPGGKNRYYKNNQNKQDHSKSGRNGSSDRHGKYPPCVHCSKTNHPEKICHIRFVSAATQRAKAAEAAGSRKRRHSDSDDENNTKKKKPDDPKGPPKWVLKIDKRGQTNKVKNASAEAGSSSSSVSDPDIAAQINEIDEIVNKDSNKILRTYLDSGAFAPMSPEISCFHNYRPIHNEPIECAGDQVLYAQGTGTLIFNNSIDGLQEIQNFTSVPGLTSTLLSKSAFTKNDLVVVFKAKKCGIFKSDAIEINKPPLLERTETNGTYCLDLDTVTDSAIDSISSHMMSDESLDDSIPTFWDETSKSSSSDSNGSCLSENMAGPSQESPPLIDNIIPSTTAAPALESIGKRKRTPKQFPDYIVYGLSKNKHKIPDRACLAIPTDSDVPQSVKDVHRSPEMDQRSSVRKQLKSPSPLKTNSSEPRFIVQQKNDDNAEESTPAGPQILHNKKRLSTGRKLAQRIADELSNKRVAVNLLSKEKATLLELVKNLQNEVQELKNNLIVKDEVIRLLLVEETNLKSEVSTLGEYKEKLRVSEEKLSTAEEKVAQLENLCKVKEDKTHSYASETGSEEANSSRLKCLPECFKPFPNCRIVLDCTEVETAVPKSMRHHNLTYSQYKHCTTHKGLVGIAPNGTVVFASKLYPGSTSDKGVVDDSKICELFNAGESIMVDKGFLITDFQPPGVSLIRPPFKTTPQFTEQQVCCAVTNLKNPLLKEVSKAMGQCACYSGEED